MDYITPAQFMEFVGAHELASLSFPDGGTPPDADLLALTISGGDRSAYTEVEQADADAAAEWIEIPISLAEAEIDSYRSPQFDPQTYSSSPLLRRCAQDIARWIAYDDDITETIQARYDRAIVILSSLRDGKLTLGDIPVAELHSAGTSDYSTPDRVFTADSLSEF